MIEGDSPFERFVAEVHKDDDLHGVEYDVFRVPSKRHDDWPRISWIWRGGTIELSDVVGGGLSADGTCRIGTAFTDHVETEIHCWGEDFRDATNLRNCVVGALYRLQGNRISFGDYEWFNEQDATADRTLSGAKVVLQVIVELPIATEAQPLTSITGMGGEGTFQDSPAGSTVETICST